MAELTHQRLLEVLSYDPVTGIFTWRVALARRVRVGDVAGGKREGGYTVIGIDGRNHRSHRLAWFYVHGEWPAGPLDHRQGVAAGDGINNLRLATPTINSRNRVAGSMAGIEHRAGRPRPWRVRIAVDRKLRTVGSFADLDAARAAYREAKQRLHPEFERGFISPISP